MNEQSPVNELFTDTGPFDVAAAASALKPFVAIQREGKQIFLKKGPKLTVERRILAYALAKKLLHTEGFAENGYLSAAEVNDATGIKKGSVDFAFKKLREDGILIGSGSQYELPHYQVGSVVSDLEIAASKGKNDER